MSPGVPASCSEELCFERQTGFASAVGTAVAEMGADDSAAASALGLASWWEPY